MKLAIAGGREIESTVLAALKVVDPTYTVNTERPFQARNKAAYEVELLAAPSQMGNLPRDEKLIPVEGLIEQEWLLKGRRVDQVVAALDGTAARVVAPDPRWMALHKLWLSRQDKRNPLKRPKDERQGHLLLAAVIEHMPHYPIDLAFRKELPEPLALLLDPAMRSVESGLLAAKTSRPPPSPRRRSRS